MQDNNVIMSDFIQYADEEKNINPELTNAYIDFIGEDDLVKLASEVVEVGMPSGYAYTYDPLEFFEDNKALILANLKNIEDLATIVVGDVDIRIDKDIHCAYVQKDKSELDGDVELINYDNSAQSIVIAVLVYMAEAMYEFITA